MKLNICLFLCSLILFQLFFLKMSVNNQTKMLQVLVEKCVESTEGVMGINRNLNHLGIFYNVEPKED